MAGQRSPWHVWLALALVLAAMGLILYFTSSVVDWAATFGAGKDLAQIIAVTVGGWWAYRRFVVQREHQPRANVGHRLETLLVDEGHRLLRVTTEIHNIGHVAIEPPMITVAVRQVSPLPRELVDKLHNLPSTDPESTRLDLDILGERSTNLAEDETILEPGEQSDFIADFVFGLEALAVEVVSQVPCGKDNPDLLWSATTLFRFDSTPRAPGTQIAEGAPNYGL